MLDNKSTEGINLFCEPSITAVELNQTNVFWFHATENEWKFTNATTCNFNASDYENGYRNDSVVISDTSDTNLKAVNSGFQLSLNENSMTNGGFIICAIYGEGEKCFSSYSTITGDLY